MDTLFSDHFCPKRKKNHHSRWDREQEECGCDEKHHNPKCKGCICALLEDLTDRNHNSFTPTRPRMHLQMKGTSNFVYLTIGLRGPTEFTLISFNPKTCCAKFTYESVTGRSTEVYVVDCTTLSAISVLQPPTQPQ